MTRAEFRQKMLDLHAESYLLTNDIKIIFDKANALVCKLMQLTGYSNDADTYAAIVSEYQEQMKGRMA